MPHFPLFLDLTDRVVLVVGTGTGAEDKIQKMQPFGCRILRREGQLTEGDLEQEPTLVILAETGNQDNARMARLCRERGIPVNVVDEPALCSFRFPALITRGALTIGLSTAGTSPAAAAVLKQHLADSLPRDLEDRLEQASRLTAQLRREIPDQRQRAKILKAQLVKLFEDDLPD